LLIVCATPPSAAAAGAGAIGGIVINGSRGRAPAAGAEVVLRADVDGQLLVAAETTADQEGRFCFEPLPIRADLEYLPGANQDGVHFPGQRLRLTPQRPRVEVELTVYDPRAEPSPLVAKRHDILVRVQSGGLEVTETILVDNPTSNCYVGRAAGKKEQPVTLRLSIPADFERTTFHQEFYGRRFSLSGGKLVTGIPWPPGQRELKFTYLLRSQEAHRLWERPLDMPCSQVTLRVLSAKPEEVSSNLDAAKRPRTKEAVFTSVGKVMPAGYVLRLELGHLPVPWMTYGKWLAALALVGSIAGTSIMMTRAKKRAARRQPTAPTARARGPSKPSSRGRRRVPA
jgi:hypothetical protein